jgi:ferredoxin
MSTPLSPLSQHFLTADSGATANARARAHAYDAITTQIALVARVNYQSDGYVLIIGTAAAADAAAQALAASPDLHICALVTDSTQPAGTVEEGGPVRRVHGCADGLTGYLGQFEIQTGNPLLATALQLSLPADKPAFDLILDLNDTPLINSEVPPPGYYAPRGDGSTLKIALEEIPTLTGGFEKPRYFRYNPAICAHGRSGISGCTRCLEACPTDAIVSNGDVIQVNPNLCQGAGSCATACPTGAITYGYPGMEETLGAWRGLLKAYRRAGGERPVLLVHDAHGGREALNEQFASLADRCLPVEVEELGSVGMDAWLAALAWGADAVYLLSTPAVPASVQWEIDFQLSVARDIIAGLGYSGDRLQCLSMDELTVPDDPGIGMPLQQPGEFAALDEKRTLIRLAVDHLASQLSRPPLPVALPPGAPFGEIRVDAERCTLCMACVSQCPAHALAAGDDSPQLRFVETNCVQCGVCSHSCPEQAIQLVSRLLYDPVQRSQLRVLNEDQPFCCIRCNKPFATRSVIELLRLKMCEDCRVKDMLVDPSDDGPGLRPGGQT